MLIDISSLVRRQRSLNPQRLLRGVVEVADVADDVDVVDPDDTDVDGEAIVLLDGDAA